MTIDERFNLITRNLQEVLTEEDLRYFLENDIPLKHYIGFELSGKLHIGSGLMTMIKYKDFMDAGIDSTIFLADWHAWINDKLGGDMDVIQGVGVRYFEEAFRACMKCVGGDADQVKFVQGSKLYEGNDRYWETVLHVAKNTTLSRVQRSISILGRKEGESVDFSKLIYPVMQVADVFVQGLSIAHAGMDQRKAHVVMRDVADKVPEYTGLPDKRKPIALHHHLILGLGKPPKEAQNGEITNEMWTDMKMSKSKPDTAVFLTDSPEDIERKISKAYCLEGDTKFNPILDWTEHLVFPIKGSLTIEREEKYGGDKEYVSYSDLEKDFTSKKLHPVDLKKALAKSLIDILKPAREHFASGKPKELLEEMQSLVITR